MASAKETLEIAKQGMKIFQKNVLISAEEFAATYEALGLEAEAKAMRLFAGAVKEIDVDGIPDPY